MNRILAFLLCIVFLNVEAMALSGGPNFTGGGTQNIFGNYSGVFIENQSQDFDSSGNRISSPASLSIVGGSVGVFSLTVPNDNTPSTGTVVVFDRGRAFTGTITGAGDAGTGQIFALIQAQNQFSFATPVPPVPPSTTPTQVITNVTATANGTLQATVTAPLRSRQRSSSFLNQQIQQSNITPGRLNGTATTQVNNGQFRFSDLSLIINRQIVYVVTGTVVPSTTTTATGTTTGTTGT